MEVENSVRIDRIIGKKTYYLMTDSRGVIIERTPIPPDNDFKFKTLKEVFNKWGHLMIFEEVTKREYPMSPDKKFERMVEKNPVIGRLKERFNCEVW